LNNVRQPLVTHQRASYWVEWSAPHYVRLTSGLHKCEAAASERGLTLRGIFIKANGR
jgi:hypothetical protein